MSRVLTEDLRASLLPVPLTVIGGFLGAGKTSVLNHILSAPHGRRIAVLVNDFGAINIDARQIVAVHGETISLENGCVCCTIRTDLVSAVIDLLSNGMPPEHIVIETSGVSRPQAVAESFLNGMVAGFVELHGLVAVLDAELGVDAACEYRDRALEQVSCADLVVLNKTDLISPGQCRQLQDEIEEAAPGSRVWATTHGAVPLELVLDGGPARGGDGELPGEGSGFESHETVFATWIYRSQRAWSCAELQRAMEKLPTSIFRAKGLVRLQLPTGDHGLLQLTGRRCWLRLCEPAGGVPDTELVFIGTPGGASNAGIARVFEEAVREQAYSDRVGRGYTVDDPKAFEVVFA